MIILVYNLPVYFIISGLVSYNHFTDSSLLRNFYLSVYMRTHVFVMPTATADPIPVCLTSVIYL